MSAGLWVTTLIAFAVPGGIGAMALLVEPRLGGLALGLLLLYAGVWLWFRPRRFRIDVHGLTLRFPLRSRVIRRDEVLGLERLDRPGAQDRLGWVIRVGVGGLFGVFGLLWSSRVGWLDCYISRTDAFVWIDRGRRRPLLCSVSDPDRFVATWRARTG
jgi:uncharacterized membrane protein YfcA